MPGVEWIRPDWTLFFPIWGLVALFSFFLLPGGLQAVWSLLRLGPGLFGTGRRYRMKRAGMDSGAFVARTAVAAVLICSLRFGIGPGGGGAAVGETPAEVKEVSSDSVEQVRKVSPHIHIYFDQKQLLANQYNVQFDTGAPVIAGSKELFLTALQAALEERVENGAVLVTLHKNPFPGIDVLELVERQCRDAKLDVRHTENVFDQRREVKDGN